MDNKVNMMDNGIIEKKKDRKTYFCQYYSGFSPGSDPCGWSGRVDEMLDYKVYSNVLGRFVPVKSCPRCIERRHKRGKDFEEDCCGWIVYTKWGFPGTKSYLMTYKDPEVHHIVRRPTPVKGKWEQASTKFVYTYYEDEPPTDKDLEFLDKMQELMDEEYIENLFIEHEERKRAARHGAMLEELIVKKAEIANSDRTAIEQELVESCDVIKERVWNKLINPRSNQKEKPCVGMCWGMVTPEKKT